MDKEKRLLKEKKQKEKKVKKLNQKRTKKLKSILDWMDIQSIGEYGIYLQKGNKEMIARGLVLLSNNIFLKDSHEKAKDVYVLSSALDRLKEVTYFKFVKTPIRLSSNINRLSKEHATERVTGRRLIKQKVDKMEGAIGIILIFFMLYKIYHNIFNRLLVEINFQLRQKDYLWYGHDFNKYEEI